MKRVQIAGLGGVPAGSNAVSANFTVVDPSAAGYLTVWNCSDERPVVSTSNFTAGDVTPNAATIPLDASGGLCVYSNVATDLVIDVNGVLRHRRRGAVHAGRPGAPDGHPRDRQPAEQLARPSSCRSAASAASPTASSAVTLNVTSVDPTAAGFVTVYACEGDAPQRVEPEPAARSGAPEPGGHAGVGRRHGVPVLAAATSTWSSTSPAT